MFVAGTFLESVHDEAVFQWQQLHKCINGQFD